MLYKSNAGIAAAHVFVLPFCCFNEVLEGENADSCYLLPSMIKSGDVNRWHEAFEHL